VIQFLSGQTNTVRTLAPVGPGYVGFSISPDSKWILYTQANPTGSGLVLVDNFR